MEARGRGSLFRLDTDGTVTHACCNGLYFANGLTATADESALVFAETQGRRLSKYWLSGPQGRNDDTPGGAPPRYPDNISHRCRRPDLGRDGVRAERRRPNGARAAGTGDPKASLWQSA